MLKQFDFKNIKVLLVFDFKKLIFNPYVFLTLGLVFALLSINFFSTLFTFEQNIYKYKLTETGANFIPIIRTHYFVSLILYILILPYFGSLFVSNEKSKGFYDYLIISHIKVKDLFLAKLFSYSIFSLLYIFLVALYPLYLSLIVGLSVIEVLVSTTGLCFYLIFLNSLQYLSNYIFSKKITAALFYYILNISIFYLDSILLNINHFQTSVLFSKLSVLHSYMSFQNGIFNISSLFMFAGYSFLFLFITYTVLNLKRTRFDHVR